MNGTTPACVYRWLPKQSLIFRNRRNEQFRINHCAVKYHAPVQMRAGGASCHSGKPQQLGFADGFAGLHIDLIQVAVHGDQSVAMVDKNRFAVEEIIPDRQHRALCSRLDRRAARYGHIEADMGGARFPIEEAAQSKAAGQLSLGGNDEVHIGILRGTPVAFQLLDGGDLAFGASEIGSRQFNLALVLERDVLLGIILGNDREGL